MTSEALEKINEYKRQVLLDLICKCTQEQRSLFWRGYKVEDIEDFPLDKIERAIQQCELTVKINEEEQAQLDAETPPIERALKLIRRYGRLAGVHYKMWVIDQVVRILTETKDEYEEWVKVSNHGELGPDTYEWDEGIAP